MQKKNIMNQRKIKDILFNQYFILAIITLLSLFIRLLNIDKPFGLWYDEMLTYIFSSKSFPLGILKTLLQEDFHMPLYYMYVHVWMKFFGSSDTILRLSSVFWGVLTVPAFFYLGKIYKSDKLGYFLSIIGCLSPIMIYYSQELRFYSMLVFFATLSIIFFLKILDKPNITNFCLLGLSNLIILYIYTMGIVFVGIETFILIIHFYLYKKDYFIHSLRYTAIFFILSTPYIILLLSYIDASNQTLLNPFGWEKQPPYILIFVINDLFSPCFTCIYGYINTICNINPLAFAFVNVSTCFFIIGFISSFKKFNKKLLYLLIILLTFFGIEIFLYLKDELILCAKYVLIVLPIVLLICTNGILSIKFNWLKKVCIFFILTTYIYNIVNYTNMSSFNLRNNGMKFQVDKLEQLNLDKNDYILYPNGFSYLTKYFNHDNFINLDVSKILSLDKTKQERLKIFNKDFAITTNKHNSMEKLIPYLIDVKPTSELMQFINLYIDKIPMGNKLIFIDDRAERINPENVRNYMNNYRATKEEQAFYKHHLHHLFQIRFYEDLYNILDHNSSLKKIKILDATNSGRGLRFTIYEKIN